MKCRFCGAKVGILERWRFGDFCSKEHKDDFAVDLVKLNEQIVQDLRRIPSLYKSGAAETTAAAPNQAPEVEPPDPPEAIFLQEADPGPLEEVAQSKPAEDGAPQRSKTDQWRLFSKMADWEGLPPSAMAASKEKEQTDRFLWVQLDREPSEGPQGVLLAGSFPAILPHRIVRQAQGHMPMSPIWVPPDFQRKAAEDAQRYAIGGSVHQWVQNHAWGWMAEALAESVPDFGPVLSAYPLTAPWTNWTVVPPSRPQMAPQQQQAMPMGAPQGMPGQSMPSNAMGGMKGAGLELAGMPTPPVSHPGPIGMQPPSMAGMPLPSPAGVPAATPPIAGTPYTAAPQSGAYAPIPPGAVPAWPAVSGLPAVGAVPSGVGPAAPPQGYAYAMPRLMPSGMTWRELPPPLFSALVDLGDLLKPFALPFVQLVPVYSSLRPTIVIAGNLPRLEAAPNCGMPFVDCQGDPSEDMVPSAPRKYRPRSHARTLWRRQLILPKPYGDVSQPRVPNCPGPAFVFALRTGVPAPVARPQLQIGRWRD
ncbi:hypothetical protein [uncultured Paludibaculum sp.]|uniref:hypothetical protein n=1 Tax=uncultured Paludibaculum sp. TaxID=1765020 RepID=UPI002AABC194|nr:hypothetical protein [uncultured Paludibaculum sp.]